MGVIVYTSRRKDIFGNFYTGGSGGGYGGGVNEVSYRVETGRVTYSGDSNAILSVLYETMFVLEPIITASLVHIVTDIGESESSGDDGTDISMEIPVITLRHIIIDNNYVGVDVYVKKSTSDFVTYEINLIIIG
jgi:hypothetical protein